MDRPSPDYVRRYIVRRSKIFRSLGAPHSTLIHWAQNGKALLEAELQRLRILQWPPETAPRNQSALIARAAYELLRSSESCSYGELGGKIHKLCDELPEERSHEEQPALDTERASAATIAGVEAIYRSKGSAGDKVANLERVIELAHAYERDLLAGGVNRQQEPGRERAARENPSVRTDRPIKPRGGEHPR
jgi:hypothetical protein